MKQPQNPTDRLSPHCTDAWSNMEEWGGKSWFPSHEEEESKENEQSEQLERFNDFD